ncbi:MAG: sulfite exporter TauE/SafE family protein, partial [Prolixibacteraceae bacterium]|nr:sulfite exporter TauE/SafE family protein [Prolixibacteraceae bacterium]
MEIYLVILFAGALLAGLLGSLTGLGGGIIIVPLLTIGLGVDIKYAVGTSLVAVIATSSGAAVSYVKEGITNFRIGMFLETATTVGAICGAALAAVISSWSLMIIFGILLLYSAFNSFKNRKTEYIAEKKQGIKENSFAEKLKLDGIYHVSPGNNISYHASHIGGGYLMMIVAGILSGLLGIGSGAFKVIAMDSIMKLPFKVSSATSNFMIGVTAAASAGVYISRGYIDPVLSMP